MPLSALQRRWFALSALALIGAYQLTRPAHAAGLPRPAASSPQESTPKRRAAQPLRFDPPAAGPARNPDYEACIAQPSPDGLALDCQALRQRNPHPELRDPPASTRAPASTDRARAASS